MVGGKAHNDSSWIKLNVGGRVFETSKQTLCSRPDSFLAKLCGDASDDDNQIPRAKDSSGAIRIDRDPKYFSVILNFLRDGDLVFGPSCSVKGIRKEAEFYILPALASLCEQEMSKTESTIQMEIKKAKLDLQEQEYKVQLLAFKVKKKQAEDNWLMMMGFNCSNPQLDYKRKQLEVAKLEAEISNLQRR